MSRATDGLRRALGGIALAACCACVSSGRSASAEQDLRLTGKKLVQDGILQLKAGNSLEAIRRFTAARQINPWNDETKSYYLAAVRAYTDATLKYLDRGDCDTAVARRRKLQALAPDAVDALSAVDERCAGLLAEGEAGMRGKPDPKRLQEEVAHTTAGNQAAPVPAFYQFYYTYLRNHLKLRAGKVHADARTKKGATFAYIPLAENLGALTTEAEARRGCTRARELLHAERGPPDVQRFRECVYGPAGSSRLSFEIAPPTLAALPRFPDAVVLNIDLTYAARKSTMYLVFAFENSETELHLHRMEAVYDRDALAHVTAFKPVQTPGLILPARDFKGRGIGAFCPECLDGDPAPDAVIILPIDAEALATLKKADVRVDVGVNLEERLNDP